jgi:hypothetical protein
MRLTVQAFDTYEFERMRANSFARLHHGEGAHAAVLDRLVSAGVEQDTDHVGLRVD